MGKAKNRLREPVLKHGAQRDRPIELHARSSDLDGRHEQIDRYNIDVANGANRYAPWQRIGRSGSVSTQSLSRIMKRDFVDAGPSGAKPSDR
jgi:hypothetical protein